MTPRPPRGPSRNDKKAAAPKKPSFVRRLLRWVEISVYLATILAVAGAVLLFLAVASVQEDLPTLEPLENYHEGSKWGQTTRVYAADGSEVGEFYEEDRVILAYSQIPDTIVRALIAVEDERYDPAHELHWVRKYGIDPIAILRASVRNVLAGRTVQGASTITQQLAKNLFLTPERSVTRKLKEAVLAYRIERRFTREEILERYLNKVFFGNGAYGIHAAASRYFGVDLTAPEGNNRLTTGQSALLVGLVRSPSLLNPFRHPEAAKSRTRVILSRMVEVGYITPEEAEAADTALWSNFRPDRRGLVEDDSEGGASRSRNAKWFVEYIRKVLVDRGWEPGQIFRGGYKITTTCDPALQSAANEAVRRGLDRLRREIGDREKKLQAALIAIDPQTGRILAVVGGDTWGERNQFNRAVQGPGRQAGSSFKPFVYLAALESGTNPDDPHLPGAGGAITAATAVRDEAFAVPNPGGPPWSPSNYDGSERGPVSVRFALRHSLNIATVRLLLAAGPEEVLGRAGSLGIPTNRMQPYPSLALGVFDVLPIDMARAYAPFANGGFRIDPYPIQEITDADGRVIYREGPPLRRQVVSPQAAYLMTSLLEDVVQRGTAASSVGAVVRRPAAGKTGTTDDYSDAWFVGYTPDLVAAVWVGFDERRSMGRGMTGGRAGGSIWADFVKTGLADRPARGFEPPPEMNRVSFCAVSGLLATPACPIQSEPVLDDRVPTATCPLHLEGPAAIAAFLGGDRADTPEEISARWDAEAGVPRPAADDGPAPPAPSENRFSFPRPPGEPR